MTILLPPGWPRPRGYSCGVVAEGATVYVSGQVGWDEQGRFVSDDFVPQVRRALENVVAVLAAGGAGPEHIVRLTGQHGRRRLGARRRPGAGRNRGDRRDSPRGGTLTC